MEWALVVLFYGPAAASLLIAGVVLSRFFIASLEHPVNPLAWPAVIGATMPQIASYAMMFFGASYGPSARPTMYLIWFVAVLFAVLGLVSPPAPARRWMFGWGLGSAALGISWLYALSHVRFGH